MTSLFLAKRNYISFPGMEKKGQWREGAKVLVWGTGVMFSGRKQNFLLSWLERLMQVTLKTQMRPLFWRRWKGELSSGYPGGAGWTPQHAGGSVS